MKVTIIGPNLRDQSKGSFHAHKAGCADLGKAARLTSEEPWHLDADTRREVAEYLYPPNEFEYWVEDPDSYINDIWFAPCLKALPKHIAEEEVLREYAYRAYNALDNFPEFGEETRVAIMDTAGDALTDDGYVYDRELLQSIVKKLA